LVATASQISAWLLIEVRGPWGRDAIAQSELGPFAPALWREAMRRRGVRVIAIRRDLEHRLDRGGHHVRLVHVVAPRPGGRAAVAHRRTLEDLHEVVSATESLLAGRALHGEWQRDDDRYVLVCTNGRHDACCATFGRPLVRALRASPWSEQVWECSHIGGDRFAGNIVLLPDSLFYGRVDPARGEALLAAHDEGRLDLACYRGRSTLRLPEQAAEHALRRELGLDRLDAITSISTLDDGRISVELGDGRAAVVRVERLAHPAPTPLTCKGRDGLEYPEFRVIRVDVAQAKPTTGRGV
jgi:hypothetical protein